MTKQLKATENTEATEVTEKIEDKAGDTQETVEAADKSESSVEETAKPTVEQQVEKQESETEVSAKTADPLESIPADQLMKADDEIIETEESPVVTGDIAQDEKLLEKFLANPSKFVGEITDAAVAKVKKLTQDESNAKTAWRNFYTENKDLEAHPELVQLMTNRLHAQWKKEGNVPNWKEGSKTLAKEVRKLVSKIRASDSDVEAVDTESKAAVVSSSGNPAPRSVTKPAERSGFVDQIRRMQESRGKTLN